MPPKTIVSKKDVLKASVELIKDEGVRTVKCEKYRKKIELFNQPSI